MTPIGLPEAGADEPSGEDRLQWMSREQRDRLAANLTKLDGLPPEERSSIREMERQLANLDPSARERYMTVMRHYHAFYQSLPEDRRKQLDAVRDPARKLELLTKLRAERRISRGPGAQSLGQALQVSSLVNRPLHRTARELILWFALDQPEDAKDKAEFARVKTPDDRRKFFQDYLKRSRKDNLSILRHDDEEFRDDERAIVDAEVRGQEPRILAEASKKHSDARKVQEEINRLRADIVRRSRDEIGKKAELKVLQAHAAEPVSPANLDRFEQRLPPWFWDALEPLPPDAARLRLHVLYRLVFPSGKEITTPAPAKPVSTPKPAAPKPPVSGAPF